MEALGVEPGDVLDEGELELSSGAPDAVADQLGLEAVDEALGASVDASMSSRERLRPVGRPAGVGRAERARLRLRQRSISLRLRPSALRRAAWARVSGWWMSRLLAIVQSALLPWRSPPLLSRCRFVLPLDASTGEAPQSAASAASLHTRSGLSLAITSNFAAVSGPMPGSASSRGAAAFVSVCSSRSSSVISRSSCCQRLARLRNARCVDASAPERVAGRRRRQRLTWRAVVSPARRC